MKLLRMLLIPFKWGYNSTGLNRVLKLLKKKVVLLGVLLNPKTYKKVLRGEAGSGSFNDNNEEKVVPKNIKIIQGMSEDRKAVLLKRLGRQKKIGYFILLCTVASYSYFIVSDALFEPWVLNVNMAAMTAFLLLRVARFTLAQQQILNQDLVPLKSLFQADERGSWISKWK